ncbi:MAG: hypothetical protein ABI947_16095 [Chloroflexota bacterium]
MNKTYIASIINRLEEIRQRPMMWIGKLTDIVPFLNGFNSACFVTVYENTRDNFYEEIVKGRGWHVSSQGPEFFMREKGLNDKEIADELLAIHIEVWKKRYDNINS